MVTERVIINPNEEVFLQEELFNAMVGAEFGGAILNQGTAGVAGSTFTQNSAVHGGAITNEDVATVTASTFSSNTATAFGGAIYSPGQLTVQSSVFSANVGSQNGGAIYSIGTMRITDTAFTGNKATQNGGVLYNAGVAEISGDTFNANTASMNGGALYNARTASVTDTNFTSNKSTSIGGGVFNAGTIVISGGTFSGNQTLSGGGMHNIGNAFVEGTVLGNNSASNGAGFFNNGTASISSVRFVRNKATANGGAINNARVLELDGVEFNANTAGSGGAIYNTGTLVLRNSVFNSNKATKTNGGGAIYNAADGSLYLDSCVFSTDKDTIVAKDSYVYVTGDLTATGGITLVGSAVVHFCPTNEISVNTTFTAANTSAISFDGPGETVFVNAQDFSTMNIQANVSWSVSGTYVLASGDLTFAPEQVITVNGEGVTLGKEKSFFGGYFVRVDCITVDGVDKLIINRFDTKIDDTDKTIGLVKIANVIQRAGNESIGFDNVTNGQLISKTSLGTNNLVLGGDKNIFGNGAANTMFKANIFANGYNLALSGLAWDGYVFGGGNGSQEDGANQFVVLEGEINVTNVFGGSRVASLTSDVPEFTTSVSVQENAIGSFSILCGGGLITTSATDVADTSLSVLGSHVDVSEGFAIAGSIVNSAVSYTVNGDTTTQINGGVFDWVVGSGFIQKAGAGYTQNGDIYLNISGGTINSVFGGIASSKAEYGTKTIIGNINIVVDSSENAVAIHTLFAGSNGTGCTIEGDISVTFTGKGSNLTFTGTNNGVIGDSAYVVSSTSGTRSFIFDNFSGDFDANGIKKFDCFYVIGDSDVNVYAYDLAGITSWNFDADSSLNWYDGHNNRFRGDTLNVGSAETAGTISEFTFFTTDDEMLLGGWEEFSAVTLFGEKALYDEDEECWVSDNYTMQCVESHNSYSLAVSAKLA